MDLSIAKYLAVPASISAISAGEALTVIDSLLDTMAVATLGAAAIDGTCRDSSLAVFEEEDDDDEAAAVGSTREVGSKVRNGGSSRITTPAFSPLKSASASNSSGASAAASESLPSSEPSDSAEVEDVEASF